MQYYECHITLVGSPSDIEEAVIDLGWSFSVIKDDIVSGKGIKCYATKHFAATKSKLFILNCLNQAANALESRFIVIRRKIELVIHDTASTKVKVNED